MKFKYLTEEEQAEIKEIEEQLRQMNIKEGDTYRKLHREELKRQSWTRDTTEDIIRRDILNKKIDKLERRLRELYEQEAFRAKLMLSVDFLTDLFQIG